MDTQEKTLLVMSPEQIADITREIITRLIDSQPKPQPQNNHSAPPMSQQEAIKFLGKSRQTFYKWRRKGYVKAYRIGGRIFYKRDELIAALQSC